MMDAGALQAARTTLRATATVVTHRDGHRTLGGGLSDDVSIEG